MPGRISPTRSRNACVAAFNGRPEGRASATSKDGIGFLGGDVILRDGFHVRGLNTATTLWCSAAVGVLAASGHLAFAAGTATGRALACR